MLPVALLLRAPNLLFLVVVVLTRSDGGPPLLRSLGTFGSPPYPNFLTFLVIGMLLERSSKKN
jgi:hypothetical protein